MVIGIRQYSIDDTANFYAEVKDSCEHLSLWMPWCHADYQMCEAREWVELCVESWRNKSAFRYLIHDADTEAILGAVGLERIEWARKTGELGYWVSSKAIKRGVATAAANMAVQAGFDVHGLKRIEINVLTDNVASNKVARNLGAVFEGTFRNKLIHNGESQPAHCYSLIPSDVVSEKIKTG